MTLMSKCAVLTGIRKMEMREYPVPETGDDDGILRVDMGGVCGSDPEMYNGKAPCNMPLILGHEITGTILRLGKNKSAVTGIKEGDRVVVENRFGCGVCKYCIQGDYNKCTTSRGYGVFLSVNEPPHLWGAYSQYLYLPPRAMIHKIDPSVPLEAACLTTSVVGNCVKWCIERGGVTVGDTVVISGPGQQGLCSTAVCKEAGASNIIVLGTSKDKRRLEMAKELGADYTVNIDEVNPVEFIKDITHGDLADVFLDMSGNAKSIAIAPDCTKIFGTISTPGQYGKDKEVAIVLDKIVRKEINLHGCHAQSYHSNEVAIKIIESRKYPLEKLVTHTFKLEDAEKAILTAGREIPGEDPIKVVITPNA